jgi:hypothetical protein
LSMYAERPRLAQYANRIADWLSKEGFTICYTYANRKHHYYLWRAFPVRIKPDTFRRILCELSRHPEYTLQKYGYVVGQESGYYWIE